MKDKIKEFFTKAKDWWQNASKKLKTIILVGTSAVLVTCLVIVVLLNRKEYVLLLDNLNTSETTQALQTLGSAGVDYDVRNSGIYVLKEDENSARMQLAVGGFGVSGLDYSTYAKGSGITTTQAEKNQYLIFETQERLQTIIETFDEVNRAMVTISMPTSTGFAWEINDTPPSASVQIVMKKDRQFTREQVQGIINLVKASVYGLEEENIAISDDKGDLKRILTEEENVKSNETANIDKLALTQKLNRATEEAIMNMLIPVYGEDRVRVTANAILDLDAKVTEQTTYLPVDPENPSDNPLDYRERGTERSGLGQQPAEGVVGAEDNVGTPQYQAEDGDDGQGTDYNDYEISDYLVSNHKNQIVKEGFEIVNMTVAVAVDAANMTDAERDGLADLVAKGANVAIENVAVQNFSFNAVERDVQIQDANAEITRVLTISAIAMAALIIIFIIIFMMLHKKNKAALAGAAQTEDFVYDEENDIYDEPEEEYYDEYDNYVYYDEYADDSSLEYTQEEPETPVVPAVEEIEPIVLTETVEQKLKAQIKELADSDPEIVAQLIRTWLD